MPRHEWTTDGMGNAEPLPTAGRPAPYVLKLCREEYNDTLERLGDAWDADDIDTHDEERAMIDYWGIWGVPEGAREVEGMPVYVCRFCHTRKTATEADIAAALADQSDAMRYDFVQPLKSNAELFAEYGRDICPRCTGEAI